MKNTPFPGDKVRFAHWAPDIADATVTKAQLTSHEFSFTRPGIEGEMIATWDADWHVTAPLAAAAAAAAAAAPPNADESVEPVADAKTLDNLKFAKLEAKIEELRQDKIAMYDHLVKAKDEAAKAREELRERQEATMPWPACNPWAAAIDEALVVSGLDCTTPESNPVHELGQLIEWSVKIALDPAVSSRALALYRAGEYNGTFQTIKTVDEILVTNKRKKAATKLAAWIREFYSRDQTVWAPSGEPVPRVPPGYVEDRKPVNFSERVAGRTDMRRQMLAWCQENLDTEGKNQMRAFFDMYTDTKGALE